MSSALPEPRPTRAAFAFIFVTVTLDMLALAIIAPVLPGLIVQFEGGDMVRAAHMTGWFGFVGALMQFIAAPALGVLSDRFGRRPVLLLSLLGLGLDYVLMALAPSLAWMFVGRVISGVTSATYAIANAYVADVTPPEERSARFGILGAAFGLGFVVGPALGGMLGAIDLRLPFWGAAVLCLLNVAYGAVVLPESLPRERRQPFAWRRANPFGALALLRSHRELAGLSAATVLSAIAHASLPNLIVLYMSFRYGWGEGTIGLAITAIGASSAIVGLGLVRPAVNRLGDRGTLRFGLLCGVVGFCVYGLAARWEWFVVGIVIMALWGLAAAPLQALMTTRVGAGEQGQLQGAITSLRGITGTVGPPFFGWVFASAIDPRSALHLPGLPFFIAAVALLLACVIAMRATAAET